MRKFPRALVAGVATATVAALIWTGSAVSAAEVPQRPMPADPRLDQLTFLASHNAMANSDEGFPFFRFPNQSYRLRDQLRHGVRGLQLDIHVHRGQVKMCHGNCWGNERLLRAGIQDVVDFLRTDSNAVVAVWLEDYTTPEQLGAELANVNGLQQVLFRPDLEGVRQNGWPTVSQLSASGKRLLIFSQRDGRQGSGVMYDRDWTVENYWTLGGGGSNLSCVTRWSEVPLDKQEQGFRRLFVMNHYRDMPSERNASTDNGTKLSNRVDQQCAPAAGRKPNYVAVDFYQKPDGGAVNQLIGKLNTYW